MKDTAQNNSGTRLASKLTALFVGFVGVLCQFSYCQFSHAEPLLNGIAIYREFSREQYLAGLYTTTLSNDDRTILAVEEEKRLQLKVVSERFSLRRFKRMWIEGMAINTPSSLLTEHSENMAKFSNMMKHGLAPGDVYTVDRGIDGITVSLNGVKLGTIADASFFNVLLRTWVGSVPPSSDFKTSLLSSGEVDPDLLARYEDITPLPTRIAAVRNSLQATPKRTARTSVSATPDVATGDGENPTIIPEAQPPGESTANAVPAEPAVEIRETSSEAEAETLPASLSETGELASIGTPEAPSPEMNSDTDTEPGATATGEGGEQELSTTQPELPQADEEELQEFTAVGLLERQLYIASLKRWVQQHLEYPRRALERGLEGNIRLEIRLRPDGKVLSTEFLEKSSHSALNRAATRAVKRAAPFPNMPQTLEGDYFTFTMPIVFKLATSQ